MNGFRASNVWIAVFPRNALLREVFFRGGHVFLPVEPFDDISRKPGFGPLRFPIGFAGGLHDRDLGFVRFGWRDYDTFTDRWTAPDPLGDKGGDPDWYGYCFDDPVNGNDPLGLWTNEYGEKIPKGRIITEYVPGWDMFFGGIGTSKKVKQQLRAQKNEYIDENDWKMRNELDNEANNYNALKGIYDTMTTNEDREIYEKRINKAKERIGK
ncbi:RHS repeat-associated core domain-containing protein [Pseudodesulfovibrio sp.]|uniref:RHS repeat domain-containing protein n=1 Tax=Pseudodesulfovibrio sp. TaxID=2035812 RepID=UPI00261A7496|nr:RHS repeat-associated core domain-containing protein [Pseudodesulfovibrio sp.]MDD3311923.1 RHS repeat-associated core domain-containing protein [Pseudodesulfovibrio sp.]